MIFRNCYAVIRGEIATGSKYARLGRNPIAVELALVLFARLILRANPNRTGRSMKCAVVVVTFHRTICGFTSAWGTQTKWTNWKFAGPADRATRTRMSKRIR